MDAYTKLVAKSNSMDDSKNMCQTAWYYVIARNMLHGEWQGNKGWSQARAIKAADEIVRIALAIQLGGYLYMDQYMEGAPWHVLLKHKDGTDDAIVSFRRKKRAESFVANVYLFTLDEIRIVE